MTGQEEIQEQQQPLQPQQSSEETPTEVGSSTAATGAAAGGTACQKQRSSNVHKSDWAQDVVYLYQFCRSGVSPSVSAFALKVETWLRITGIKYENVDHKMRLKSKKGQIPFVELNGAEIADSAIIICELGKYFNKDLDDHLTREQRILSHAFCIMLDHHTNWVYHWWRFNNAGEFLKESKLNIQQALATRIPNGLLTFLFKLKMRGKKSVARAQGIGVHKPEEIYDFGNQDLEKLNEYLGGKPFFFGEHPSVLDCYAFCHLVQILTSHGEKFPLKIFIEESCPQLKAFVERIKERYWPDWEEMCNTRDLNTHLPKPTPPPAKDVDDDVKKEQDREKDKEKDEESGENKLEKDEKEKEKVEDEKQQSDNKLEEKIEEKDTK